MPKKPLSTRERERTMWNCIVVRDRLFLPHKMRTKMLTHWLSCHFSCARRTTYNSTNVHTHTHISFAFLNKVSERIKRERCNEKNNHVQHTTNRFFQCIKKTVVVATAVDHRRLNSTRKWISLYTLMTVAGWDQVYDTQHSSLALYTTFPIP